MIIGTQKQWQCWAAAGLLCLAAAAPVPPPAPHTQKSKHPAAPTAAKAKTKAHAALQADAARAAAAAAAARRQAAANQRAAAEAQQRATALAQQRAAETARLRAIETKVQNTASQLHQAAAAEHQAEEDVQQRAADLSSLLPMALRMSLYPAETVLAAPGPPDTALQGLLATQGVSSDVARQVTELRQKEAAAAALKADVARKQQALTQQRAQQAAAAASLDRKLGAAQKTAHDAEGDFQEAAGAAAILAARADDLRSAIAAMDAAEKAAAQKAADDVVVAAQQKKLAQADAARARQAALSRPAGPGLQAGTTKITLVAGTVARAFGAPSDDGPATGITFSTAPAAYVASPCLGRVGFAAPFRSYGRLMIIECGGGYDFVLAGMERLDARVGHQVRPGEPVGRMADYDPAHVGDHPGLYVELRKNGQPVNPLPYLSKG
jgi:septal ring factor EnvC (AmiA/AmiB activator)